MTIIHENCEKQSCRKLVSFGWSARSKKIRKLLRVKVIYMHLNVQYTVSYVKQENLSVVERRQLTLFFSCMFFATKATIQILVVGVSINSCWESCHGLGKSFATQSCILGILSPSFSCTKRSHNFSNRKDRTA